MVHNLDKAFSKSDMKSFLKMLSPMAPHVAEELWSQLGHTESIAYEPWPEFDENMLVKNEMEIVIQVLGKKRATLTVPVDISQEMLEDLAKKEPHVQDFIAGKEIIKVIYVPKRLMNLVVK